MARSRSAATYLVRDTEVKGFVLVVTPAGAKSYAVDYRAGSGRGVAEATADDRQARLAVDTGDGADRGEAAARRSRRRPRSRDGTAAKSATR